jgi:hypothetical protein
MPETPDHECHNRVVVLSAPRRGGPDQGGPEATAAPWRDPFRPCRRTDTDGHRVTERPGSTGTPARSCTHRFQLVRAFGRALRRVLSEPPTQRFPGRTLQQIDAAATRAANFPQNDAAPPGASGRGGRVVSVRRATLNAAARSWGRLPTWARRRPRCWPWEPDSPRPRAGTNRWASAWFRSSPPSVRR